MLKGQTRLRELKLHWNRINGIGGKLIAEALYHNDYLKVLDISYNSMGIGDPECSVYWAKMLSKDSRCGLIHLDLSYNRFLSKILPQRFDEVSSKIISNELKNNNTIFGLHYKGNSGEIDCQGFLVKINSIDQNSSKQEQEIQSTFRRMKAVKQIPNEIKGKFGVMENCWICEGWQEKEFIWNPTFSGPVEFPPVFIHFNFDGYKPHQMKYINFNGRKYFSLFQMVPPNTKILYFFTAAGNQLHAKDQQWTIQEATIHIQFADKSKECFLNKLNIIRTSVSHQLYDSEYTMLIDCIPRKQELEAFMPKQQMLNFQWDIQNSVFEDRVKNSKLSFSLFSIKIFKNKTVPNENFFNQCFEFDWRWGVRLNRAVKEVDQLEKLKAYFKSHYSKLIKLYKYYASYQPSGEIWCWNQQIYQEFVVETGIVDGRYFKIKDSLLCFIMSNNLAETKTHPHLFNEYQLMLNPENCLIRYQMIEIFTLISIEKYIKPGLCKTLVDAVETLFKHGLGNIIDNIPDSQEWRDNKLYTEKLFQQLFNKYSKRRDPKDTMGLFDFKQFLQDYKFQDVIFKIIIQKIEEKTINIIFNSSIPIQVDELNKQTHMQMDLMSFIEALARLADQYSFIPYKQEQDNFWTKEKCQENPLHIKFESFILKLIKNSNNISFQNEFDYQDNSMFLEDFESLKHGKQILEKTRKMIQKKVVGTISTILMMRGKKEKEKTYSLTNQAPSSFSIGSTQQNNQKDQNIHQQQSGSFFNIKLKNITQGSKLDSSNKIDSDESRKQDKSDQNHSKYDNLSKRNSEDVSILNFRKNTNTEEDEIPNNQSPQKRRSLMYLQTQKLKNETSLGSNRPSSPAYSGVKNLEIGSSSKIISRDLSDIKSNRKSQSKINIQGKSKLKLIKDFETPNSKAFSLNSTEINESSNQKKIVQEPKIKILFNPKSKLSSNSPSTAVSSLTSKSNLTSRAHFFPKKATYDINEIKKSVFTLAQSQLDLNTPNVLVTQNSYLQSPTKLINKNPTKRKNISQIAESN